MKLINIREYEDYIPDKEGTVTCIPLWVYGLTQVQDHHHNPSKQNLEFVFYNIQIYPIQRAHKKYKWFPEDLKSIHCSKQSPEEPNCIHCSYTFYS